MAEAKKQGVWFTAAMPYNQQLLDEGKQTFIRRKMVMAKFPLDIEVEPAKRKAKHGDEAITASQMRQIRNKIPKDKKAAVDKAKKSEKTFTSTAKEAPKKESAVKPASA